MTDDEISKAARDAFTYGTGFMRDGKHVPVKDVYMSEKDAVTDDLVKRLREDAIDHRDVAGCCDCDPKDTRNWRHALNVEEAADRIEQLEGALRLMLDNDRNLHRPLEELFAEFCMEARAALGEKKD